jgi:tetratricopeptide (TPR) repeat protein
MQHQDGDQYGLVASNDLRDLLTYFARPDNQSFCLVTSRAPLLDLMDYTTYSHHDVDRLSEADGVALLEKLGVQGSEEKKRQAIRDWDGHALTVSLLGSYLAEKHGGDLAHLAELPVPTAAEPRYERVHRVLRRYDEHLTATEREFLKLFSAFRTPVHVDAFEKVFAPLLGIGTTNGGVGATHPDQKIVQSGKSTSKNAAQSGKTGSPLARWANRLFGTKTGTPDDYERATRPSPDGTNLGQNPAPDGLTVGPDGSPLPEMVNRLVTYRILKHDPVSQTYTAHPLVRNHYLALLTKGDNKAQEQDAHLKIKDYYLSLAGDTPTYPTLDDLKPLIEVVHHACEAGAYDEADQIFDERICQKNKFVLMHQLGAYETELEIKFEFFPNRDMTQEPLVSKSDRKRWILATIGLCLMSLGRLREAVPFYERFVKLATEAQDWHNASITYQNLAELHAALGALEASAAAARQALDLARRAENKQAEQNSLTRQAWPTYLLGNISIATDSFVQAEVLQREIDPNIAYLYSAHGIFHADILHRTKQSDYARRVTESNLQICERNHFAYSPGMCHRVLGDLDADAGNQASARVHYDTALKRARNESHRPALIEALLARGRFLAKTGAANEAFNDLNEALNYAVEGGYRIYEADIRVALGWAWLGVRDQVSGVRAQAEAERALQMSQELGYYWGRIDAEEVLKEIESRK